MCARVPDQTHMNALPWWYQSSVWARTQFWFFFNHRLSFITGMPFQCLTFSEVRISQHNCYGKILVCCFYCIIHLQTCWNASQLGL